ncbi:MAG: pentapeptide repeat-containing protein [Terracidiphilus sp.]
MALPLLGVTLPMVAFFELTPWLFVLAHFFILIQIFLLSRTLSTFNKALAADQPNTTLQIPIRAQLDGFFPTQLLAGVPGTWLARQFVSLSCWISLIVAPLALLLFFQVQFLAYHDVTATYLHRAAILADLMIVWLIWPAILDPAGRFGPEVIRGIPTLIFQVFESARGMLQRIVRRLRAKRPVRAGSPPEDVARSSASPTRHLTSTEVLSHIVAFVLSALVVSFSFLVATIPQEAMEEWVASRLPELKSADVRAICGSRPEQPARLLNLKTLNCLLSPKVWTGVRSASNDATLAMNGWSTPWKVWWPTVILFEGPVDYENERSTSWFARNLVLVEADLVGTKNSERTVSIRLRDLRFANFFKANLQKVDLSKADLTGADFRKAHLQEANMNGIAATTARFDEADMTGVQLEKAHLQGASMQSATLEEAKIKDASLDGADLTLVEASGADFTSASLIASTFRTSVLQNADLTDADLSGADMTNANLAGAFVTCTTFTGATLSAANLVGIQGHPDPCGESSDLMKFADLRGATIEERKIGNKGPQAQAVGGGNSDQLPTPSDDSDASWKTRVDHSWTEEDETGAGDLLADMACDWTPYVATGIVRRMRQAKDAQLVAAFVGRVAARLQDNKCRGASTMSLANRNRLENLRSPPAQ